MAILREQDLCKQFTPTEDQIKYAQKMIDQWETVREIMESPGWQILIDYFRSQLQQYDSISNAGLDDFLYRKGVANGINMLLQSPKRLKQNATSAANFLKEAELASNKE